MKRIAIRVTDMIFDKLRVHFREKVLNPLLGELRRKKLINRDFAIISNNCWGGHVYRYFNMEYESPTVGMYFYAEEYIKFLSNLKYYMGCELKIISAFQSKYYKELQRRGEVTRLIGLLDDVESCYCTTTRQKKLYLNGTDGKSVCIGAI